MDPVITKGKIIKTEERGLKMRPERSSGTWSQRASVVMLKSLKVMEGVR